MKLSHTDLLNEAKRARENAYAPYSDFTVGAALLCRDGSLYRGCNVESASFSPTCCAERTALFSAVADGKRELSAIAVIGGRRGERGGFCPPCGVCRQALSEFSDGSLSVILEDGEGNPVFYRLEELLPVRFGDGVAKKGGGHE